MHNCTHVDEKCNSKASCKDNCCAMATDKAQNAVNKNEKENNKKIKDEVNEDCGCCHH